jgi:hypothetical protein
MGRDRDAEYYLGSREIKSYNPIASSFDEIVLRSLFSTLNIQEIDGSEKWTREFRTVRAKL